MPACLSISSWSQGKPGSWTILAVPRQEAHANLGPRAHRALIAGVAGLCIAPGEHSHNDMSIYHLSACEAPRQHTQIATATEDCKFWAEDCNYAKARRPSLFHPGHQCIGPALDPVPPIRGPRLGQVGPRDQLLGNQIRAPRLPR